MLKNTASQYIAFNAVSSTDGSAITTGTPTVYYTIDGGTQATSTNTAVHEGNGQWSLALTQAETNGDHITYTMVLTNAINSMVQAYPITLSDFMADVSALATSAEITALNDITAADVYAEFTSGANEDAFKADVSGLATSAEIAALNDFDPATDQVTVATNNDKSGYQLDSSTLSSIADAVWDELQSGHNTVGSFGYYLDSQVSAAGGGTAPTEAEIYTYFTSSSREDLFKADVSSLATSAEIAALNDITAADVYAEFTSGTNEDAFKADVSSLATSAEIAALNDISAADVYTLFTTGSNADAFKADVSTLSTFDPATDTVTTDAASRTASQADVSALATSAEIAALNDITANDVYLEFTSGSNEDAFKADVSGLATSAEITALNNLSTTDVETAVWDAAISSHNVGGSFGKAVRQMKEGLVTDESSVNDASATTTSFVTALTSSVDDFYNDKVIVFTSGALTGQSRVIANYVGATKTMTMDEPLTSAPANADEFIILSVHTHTVEQVAQGVYAEFTSGSNEDAFKADVSGLATSAEIAALNDITANDVYLEFTSGTNEDAFKADVSGLATSAEIAALNDFDPASDQVIVATNNDKTGYSLSTGSLTDIVNGVWDEDQSLHTTVGTFGSYLDQAVSTVGGGGGTSDWTAQERSEIRYRLGIDGTTAAPVTNTPDLATASSVATLQTTADKWETMVQVDGSNWAFTVDALANAPSGGGGVGGTDWSAVEREQIRYRLGIDGNIDVPSTNNPDLARNTTAQTVIDALTIEIDGLNDFNPATDTVARVTLVDTTTVNTDMVDVSALALEASVQGLNDVSASDVYAEFTALSNADAFKADVTALATSAQIAALNDFNPATDTVARVTLVDTTTVNSDMVDVTGMALEASVQALNDPSAADIYNYFTGLTRANLFKADVTALATSADISALNDFNPATDTVARVTLVDTTTTNTDMVDISGLATSAEIASLNDLSLSEIVNGVWDENQSLHNTIGTFGAYLDGQVTSAGGDDAATIYAFFTAGSNEDAFKANVSGLATSAEVAALPTAGDVYTQFVAGTNADAFKADVSALALQATLTAQNDLSSSQVASAVWDSLQSNHTTFGSFGFYLDSTVSTAGGGSMTPSDIYAYFTDVSREDAFKADVSALALEASVTALPSAADTYTYFAAGNRPDPFKADVTALATQAQVASLNDFDPTVDTVQHVALVDVTTTNTDMVDISGLATTARIDALNDFDPATDIVQNVNTVQNVVNIGQGLTGPSVLTITVSDGSNPIENAQVVVKRTGESGFKVTDSNGQAQFAVSDSTYDIVVIAAGHEGVVDSVVVSGATGKAITMSATVLPVPSQPELCVVACYVQLNGQPVENAVVRATLVNSNSAIDGIVLSNSKDVAETDINGYAQLELIRLDQFVDGDGQYLIEVFDGNNKLWSTTSTIPNTGAVNLEDLV